MASGLGSLFPGAGSPKSKRLNLFIDLKSAGCDRDTTESNAPCWCVLAFQGCRSQTIPRPCCSSACGQRLRASTCRYPAFDDGTYDYATNVSVVEAKVRLLQRGSYWNFKRQTDTTVNQEGKKRRREQDDREYNSILYCTVGKDESSKKRSCFSRDRKQS